MCVRSTSRRSYTHVLFTLQWRHNRRDSVSNHQPHDCLLSRLFIRRSKKISKLRVTGLCAGNSPVTGEFPAQMASNAENVCIWWRHHATFYNLPVLEHPWISPKVRQLNYWEFPRFDACLISCQVSKSAPQAIYNLSKVNFFWVKLYAMQKLLQLPSILLFIYRNC